MQYIAVFIAALGLATAAPSDEISIRQLPTVGSFDRYAGPGCTGTICNIAGAGDVHAGCNPITDSCTASLKLAYLNAGCKATIWTDSTCSSNNQFANITSFDCYALGPPIRSISVTC